MVNGIKAQISAIKKRSVFVMCVEIRSGQDKLFSQGNIEFFLGCQGPAIGYKGKKEKK